MGQGSREQAPRRGPEEEPERRKGPDDPFVPVDPEDPFRIKREPKPDPYSTDDPTEPPTRDPGLTLLPPMPPAAPADPPGRTELRHGVEDMQRRVQDFTKPDASLSGSILERGLENCDGLLRPGRNALGEQWQLMVELMIAHDSALLEPGSSDVDDLTLLRSAVGRHQADITSALGDWCAARDRVPPDERTLAEAMGRARDAVDSFLSDIRAIGDRGLLLEGRVAPVALLSETALIRMAKEGVETLEGRRIASAGSGAGLSECLLLQTADHNLRNRLGGRLTWGDTALQVKSMIGKRTLATAMTEGVGKVDLGPAGVRLAHLDKSLKAREEALKGTEPVDYQVRSDVLQGYLGAIRAYATSLATIRRGAAEIQSGKRGGWSAAKAQEATDIVVVMLRHLQNELAADPLAEDPDLASMTRKAIADIDALPGRSSLEVAADGLGRDLRKAWSTAKAAELKALKKAGFDTTELKKAFDSGLGPALDTWTAEVAKFPRHDRTKLKQAASDVALVLAQYRATVERMAGERRSSGLVRALDATAVAMTRQIASYDQRGGLF